jgi:hypothetical protein
MANSLLGFIFLVCEQVFNSSRSFFFLSHFLALVESLSISFWVALIGGIVNVVEISMGSLVNSVDGIVSYIVAMHLINTFHFTHVLHIFWYPCRISPLIYPNNNSYTITSVFTAIRGTDVSQRV